MKFSEELEKVTLPGSKATVRVYAEEGQRPAFDMLCLKDEVAAVLEQSQITYFTKKALDDQAQTLAVSSKRVLLTQPILIGGKEV